MCESENADNQLFQSVEKLLKHFFHDSETVDIAQIFRGFRPLVLHHAGGWINSGLSFKDRCREILSEIFLILTLEFDPSKAANTGSAFSYLSLRLRRMTRPKGSRDIPFGLAGDLPDKGRLNFTPMRMEMVSDMVRCIRRCLVQERHEQIRLLEFIFIHINPELAWISRLIASKSGENVRKRLESDKKRHQRFNRLLRSAFDGIVTGDWREIRDWSRGERSHLAWKIVSFSPAERCALASNALELLETWRDETEIASFSMHDKFSAVQHAIGGFSKLYQTSWIPDKFYEEAAPYGDAIDEDLLAELLLPSGCVAGSIELHENLGKYASTKDISQKERACDECAGCDEVESGDFEEALLDFLRWASLYTNQEAGKIMKRGDSR